MRAMKLVGKDWVFQQFVLWQSQLLRIRRDFHEHPELGFPNASDSKTDRGHPAPVRCPSRIDLKSVPGGVIAVISAAGLSCSPTTSGKKCSPLSRFEPGLTRLRRRNETTSFTAAGIRGRSHPGARRRNSLASRGRPGFRARHKAWKFDPRSDFRARF